MAISINGTRIIAMGAMLTLALAAGWACGGGDDKASPSPSATAESSANSTDAEAGWLRQVYALECRASDAERQIPGFGADTASMTLDQRQARAQTYWLAHATIHDEFAAARSKITVPPRVAALDKAIAGIHASWAEQDRRSFAEIDTIFASLEAVEGNNVQLQNAERAAIGVADDLFRADPPIKKLYEALPECADLDASATPKVQ
jgi:hypothetical protein